MELEEQISITEHLIDQTQRKMGTIDGSDLSLKLAYYQAIYKTLTTNGTKDDRQCNSGDTGAYSNGDHDRVS